MCFVFIWEQTATCPTYSINWLVFITEMKSVYSAVRTGSGFYNRDEKCLQHGTDWVFKYSSQSWWLLGVDQCLHHTMWTELDWIVLKVPFLRTNTRGTSIPPPFGWLTPLQLLIPFPLFPYIASHLLHWLLFFELHVLEDPLKHLQHSIITQQTWIIITWNIINFVVDLKLQSVLTNHTNVIKILILSALNKCSPLKCL